MKYWCYYSVRSTRHMSPTQLQSAIYLQLSKKCRLFVLSTAIIVFIKLILSAHPITHLFIHYLCTPVDNGYRVLHTDSCMQRLNKTIG